MMKYSRQPPHVLRRRLADRLQPLGAALTAGRLHASGPAIHPRLSARAGELGAALNLDDPAEIEAVLEDLQTLLTRCGLHLRAQATQRKVVHGRRPKPNDESTRAPSPGRGRPTGANNYAWCQLGLGLAQIWSEQTGNSPTRTYDPITKREDGRYLRFVRLVVDIVPRDLRRKGKDQIPNLDYLVRQSIKDFAAAQVSPEEYRRRGLIDDIYWYQRVAGSKEQPPPD